MAPLFVWLCFWRLDYGLYVEVEDNEKLPRLKALCPEISSSRQQRSAILNSGLLVSVEDNRCLVRQLLGERLDNKPQI